MEALQLKTLFSAVQWQATKNAMQLAYKSYTNSHGRSYNGDFGPANITTESNGNKTAFKHSYISYTLYGTRGTDGGYLWGEQAAGIPRNPPPIAPIRDWLKRYNIDANEYAVRWSIYKYGTKPNNFLKDAKDTAIKDASAVDFMGEFWQNFILFDKKRYIWKF